MMKNFMRGVLRGDDCQILIGWGLSRIEFPTCIVWPANTAAIFGDHLISSLWRALLLAVARKNLASLVSMSLIFQVCSVPYSFCCVLMCQPQV